MNINQLMKQAQGMQQKMQEMQDKLANSKYTGKAGGELVTITTNGQGRADKASFDPSLLTLENKEMLEDLVVAAINDARQKIEQDSQNLMPSELGNMKLPSGMKFPF